MIEIISYREKPGMKLVENSVITKTIGQAAKFLVKYELGYGGVIVDFTPITVVTHVLSCKDTTIFSGTEEDLKLLIEISLTYCELREMFKEKLMDNLIHRTGGIPLFITALGPEVPSECLGILSCLVAIGVDKSMCDKVLHLDTTTAWDLIEILIDEGIDEARRLL